MGFIPAELHDVTEEELKVRHERRKRQILQAFEHTITDRAIPPSLLQCRVLKSNRATGYRGAHVQFVVNDGGEEVLQEATSIQQTFMQSLCTSDKDALEWVYSVGWAVKDQHAARSGIVPWTLQRA